MIRTSVLNAWRVHLFRGGAVPTLIQILRIPQFFFAKFRKKYAWIIRVYTVTIKQYSLFPNISSFHINSSQFNKCSISSSINIVFISTVFLRIQDEVFFWKCLMKSWGSSCNRRITYTRGCDLSNYVQKWFDLERLCAAVLSVTMIILPRCDCYCDFSISVIIKCDWQWL